MGKGMVSSLSLFSTIFSTNHFLKNSLHFQIGSHLQTGIITSSVTSNLLVYKVVLLTSNSFPDKKNLDTSKLRRFSVNKNNMVLITRFVFDRAENIVGEGGNAD